MSQLTTTIDVNSLTFADWLAIAQHIGNEPRWGFYKWQEFATPQTLASLKLEDWEKIAAKVEYSGQWAYKRFRECQPTTAA